MAFSEDQIKELKKPLSRDSIKTRQEQGRQLSYIEGWKAISEANRVFGFGYWSSSVDKVNCVVSTVQGEYNFEGKDRDGAVRKGYLIGYTAQVTVTVYSGGDDYHQHTDVGYGQGINYSNVGQAHESAIKEAVTDAEKRALRHWGNAFGLALYDKEQSEVEAVAPPRPQAQPDNKPEHKYPWHKVGRILRDKEISNEKRAPHVQWLEDYVLENPEVSPEDLATMLVNRITDIEIGASQ